MKTRTKFLLAAIAVLSLAVGIAAGGRADTTESRRPLRPALELAAARAPAMSVVEDALHDKLFALADDLADSSADRSEPRDMRVGRLGRFVDDIERAVHEAKVAPGYGACLVWIAHRETRIARNPRQLGDEDQGHAAGPWSIWREHHAGSPWSASTALRILREHPGAWSLRDGATCAGYPEAERWIRAHPLVE